MAAAKRAMEIVQRPSPANIIRIHRPRDFSMGTHCTTLAWLTAELYALFKLNGIDLRLTQKSHLASRSAA
jgi:hypothetical protein